MSRGYSSDLESSDTLFDSSDINRRHHKLGWQTEYSHGRRPIATRIPWWLHSFAAWLNILAATLFLGVFLSSKYSLVLADELDKICFDRSAMHSPLVGNVDLSYHETTFSDLSLSADNNIYCNNPSPEVDAAWEELGISWNNMTFSHEDGIRAGIPADSVRTPEEYGSNFVGGLEAFYQLQCLNLLRKVLHFNFDYYSSLRQAELFDSPEKLKMHTNHCVDTLRLNIMCASDVTLRPAVWTSSSPWLQEENKNEQPQLLHNIHNTHKCRDFNAVRDWYRENQDPRPFSSLSEWRPGPGEEVVNGRDYD